MTSASLSILWNGERLESFKPSRGIRHGDPLSPYLFVLCMDVLSQNINVEVVNGAYLGIKLSRNGSLLFHLCFANDLLLFEGVYEK